MKDKNKWCFMFEFPTSKSVYSRVMPTGHTQMKIRVLQTSRSLINSKRSRKAQVQWLKQSSLLGSYCCLVRNLKADSAENLLPVLRTCQFLFWTLCQFVVLFVEKQRHVGILRNVVTKWNSSWMTSTTSTGSEKWGCLWLSSGSLFQEHCIQIWNPHLEKGYQDGKKDSGKSGSLAS